MKPMRTTDFEPMLPKLVAARFPSVEGFRVDHMAENVQPVEYEDGRGRKANEWPPVARWRVGSMRYSYVLKPRFVAERWQMTPLFGGTTVRADYSAEDEKLWQLLQWSVEGKTADEINRLLGHRQPNAKVSGDGLATAILKMPTLCARDYRHPGRSRWERTGGSQGEVLPQVVGGPLNPTWCEWFMGFPRGWSELPVSATRRCPSAQPQPGECSLVA